MSKPKRLEKCPNCNEYFKRVKGAHEANCPAVRAKKSEEYNRSLQLKNAAETGAKEVMQTQSFRGKEAIISLAECIAKLNQAFAQVVGEWRF